MNNFLSTTPSGKKVTLFMLFCFMSMNFSSLKAQNVTLSHQTKPLKEVLSEIEKQTGYKFFYNNSQVNVYQNINVSSNKENLTHVLTRMFQGTNISFKITDKTILLSVKNNVQTKDNKQKKQLVSGIIKDNNGETIIGASIKEKGTKNGTVTDVDGKFSMEVAPGAMLEISYIGYTTQTVRANGRKINVTLSENATVMDEVVVVGYGMQKKSDLTGAVVSITSDALDSRPSTNLIQSLEGAVPGLNVSTTGNNAEGSSSVTRIRGEKSISADNKPLIILDGIPFDGPWSELNPNDIKSIEVLKDASSSAIYGARGANGVILVTSKRGEKGKLSVSYNGYVTFDKAYNFPKLMTGEEFYKYKEEALRLANTTTPTPDNPTPWMGSFTQTELEMHEAGESTDWLREVTRTGVKKQHNLSLRGGADKTRFFISLNYTDNKGTAKGNEFERFNIRFNLDQDFTSWLHFATSTQLGRYDRGGSTATFWRAFRMVPLSRAYNEDGSIPNASWEDSSEAFAVNPLNALNNKTKDVRMKVITNNSLEVKFPFVKGVKL